MNRTYNFHNLREHYDVGVIIETESQLKAFLKCVNEYNKKYREILNGNVGWPLERALKDNSGQPFCFKWYKKNQYIDFHSIADVNEDSISTIPFEKFVLDPTKNATLEEQVEFAKARLDSYESYTKRKITELKADLAKIRQTYNNLKDQL